MKPKNNSDIWKGYWLFSFYLVCTVGIAVSIYSLYVKTSKVEVERIVKKTEEYDKIYVHQIELTEKIDSLYRYITLFNSNLNDGLLLNSVSNRKQEILLDMEALDNKDIKLYSKLMQEVNIFLSVKDSIKLLKMEEELVRSDLLKCMENNEKTARRMSLDGINR